MALASPGAAAAGTITEFSIPTAAARAHGITAGPDGNLWFTEALRNKIGRVTPTGTFKRFSIPSNASSPLGITAGPDGNLWFTESDGEIGRITPKGAVTEYSVPTANGDPEDITAGADGNLWFTENLKNRLGRVTPMGTFTQFRLPTARSYPERITAGPDGTPWFTESIGNKVGRITDKAEPALTLQPPSGPPGIVVQVGGSGFGSFERVKLSFVDSVNGTTVLGKAMADSSGHLKRTVTVPGNATPGAESVRAKGLISGIKTEATFTVT